jgi:hypothetical protein
LDNLGQYFGAGLLNSDSDQTKRIKIQYAVRSQRNRSLWLDDIKIQIDAITGHSSSLYNIVNNDDSIEVGYLATDPDYYWSTEGGYVTTSDLLGTWEVGSYDEYVIAGNVYIDLGYVASSGDLDLIENSIQTFPAYFQIFLGFTTGTVFTVLRKIG